MNVVVMALVVMALVLVLEAIVCMCVGGVARNRHNAPINGAFHALSLTGGWDRTGAGRM